MGKKLNPRRTDRTVPKIQLCRIGGFSIKIINTRDMSRLIVLSVWQPVLDCLRQVAA